MKKWLVVTKVPTSSKSIDAWSESMMLDILEIHLNFSLYFSFLSKLAIKIRLKATN